MVDLNDFKERKTPLDLKSGSEGVGLISQMDEGLFGVH